MYKFSGNNSEKPVKYAENTLDYTEISTVNKSDTNKSLSNVLNNSEKKSTSKSYSQFKLFNCQE